MNNEFLRGIKKHTDTIVQQAKTQPEGTLEFKIITQMKTFSFDIPIIFVEEGK